MGSFIFSAVETRHPFEAAVTQIAEAIRAGEFMISDRLPSERALAAQMDISRPTLREAVRILVDEGVLEVRKGVTGGIFVKSDVLPERIDSSGWKLRMTEISDLLEMRRIIQVNVALLAGERATEQDVAAMAETLKQLEASANDRARFMMLDERFQLTLAKASQNQVLFRSVQTILQQLRVARDFALREDRIAGSDWALVSLRSIFAAVTSGDPAIIRTEMDGHLSYLETIWREEMAEEAAQGQSH